MNSIFILIVITVLTAANGNSIKDIHQTENPTLHPGNLINRTGSNKPTRPGEDTKEFWWNMAQNDLLKRLQQRLNKNPATNVIFFLGDGNGMATTIAARIRKGQLKGKTGEEEQLSFEKFPYTGLSKTYCTNAQVPDSACTATAYLCGVKTNFFTIGVNARVNVNNCTESMNPANHVSSIAAWAQKAGKSTGFITTTTLTHASPAGSYAHVANRFWESDADITTYTQGQVDPSSCTDIAQQLVTQEPGKNFNIMLGGGMGKFLPKTIRDAHGNMGERQDGQNLLSKWKSLHPKGAVVTDRAGLLGLKQKNLNHIMGLFQSGLMDYHARANSTKQPTLEEMTEVAIRHLSKNTRGYFIFIEGGLIDYGNHENIPGLAIDEVLEMDKAIEKARSMTSSKDTLIVVSADHSHPLSIVGYPARGNDILGLNKLGTDSNGMNFATLNYAVGPKQYLDENGKSLNLEPFIENKPLAIHPSYVSANSGQHAGDDVAVYASGPFEHLFRGVLQQNSLPHFMAYAACIGDGPKMCT